jgi:hypothetical protein
MSSDGAGSATSSADGAIAVPSGGSSSGSTVKLGGGIGALVGAGTDSWEEGRIDSSILGEASTCAVGSSETIIDRGSHGGDGSVRRVVVDGAPMVVAGRAPGLSTGGSGGDGSVGGDDGERGLRSGSTWVAGAESESGWAVASSLGCRSKSKSETSCSCALMVGSKAGGGGGNPVG